MAAPRATQWIALRRLAAGGQQCRHLHMTGPATFPSPLLTAERPASNLPRDIAGLRAECKRRKIDFSGSKQELTTRLSADDLTHSRAFSTAIEQSKRPVAASTTDSPAQTVRQFNTSRELKAVKDSSTIDFAFFPGLDPDTPSTTVRVPIVPDAFHTRSKGGVFMETPDADVMRPQIVSVSQDKSTFSPMAEVHDNSAMPIDFHAMSESIAAVTKKVQEPVEEQISTLKQLWYGLVEDFRGAKQQTSKA